MASHDACQHMSCGVLHQIQFPSHFQGQPHIELITIIELGLDQSIGNFGKVLLNQDGTQCTSRSWWYVLLAMATIWTSRSKPRSPKMQTEVLGEYNPSQPWYTDLVAIQPLPRTKRDTIERTSALLGINLNLLDLIHLITHSRQWFYYFHPLLTWGVSPMNCTLYNNIGALLLGKTV